MYSLANKVVLVTGAGSGIGRALAQQLSAKGAKLALADWDADGLQETETSLQTPVLSAQLDVADKRAFEDFAKQAIDHYGVVDAVINNAGVALLQRAQDLNYDDLEWVMNINFWGVIYGTHAVLPQMLARNTGYIVNISSLYGQIAWPGNSAYCAAKFAVRGYTEVMTQDLAGTGVHSLSVHPGGIQTNIVRNARVDDAGDGNTKAAISKSFDKIAMTSPDKAAAQILRAMEKEKVKLIIGQDAKLLDRLQRLMPVSYRWLIRRMDNVTGVAKAKKTNPGNAQQQEA
jgi:NADP-dependent 3-hydroxy acid dehydrogenase YdfG